MATIRSPRYPQRLAREQRHRLQFDPWVLVLLLAVNGGGAVFFAYKEIHERVPKLVVDVLSLAALRSIESRGVWLVVVGLALAVGLWRVFALAGESTSRQMRGRAREE